MVLSEYFLFDMFITIDKDWESEECVLLFSCLADLTYTDEGRVEVGFGAIVGLIFELLNTFKLDGLIFQ